MDLSGYSLEDLLLSALRAEMNARDMYQSLASEVPNAFLNKHFQKQDMVHRLAVKSQSIHDMVIWFLS